MPNENTQPEKEAHTNLPQNNSRETASAQPADDAQTTPPKGGVVHGALNNALMRTFRSDMKETSGKEPSLPKQKQESPAQAQSIPEQVKDSPKKPAPESRARKGAVVHTFKDDVQNLVRNRKMSLSRMTALESDRGAQQRTATQEPGGWRVVVMVALGILFLVAAGLIAGGAYYSYILNTAPPEQTVEDPSFIFTETRERIDVTGRASYEIKRALAQNRRTSSYALGAVAEWYLTRSAETASRTSEADTTTAQHLSATEFFDAIDADVADTFVRSIDNYLLGVQSTDDGAIPFLILTTTSQGYAFSGLFAWESSIEEDLSPLFSPGGTYVRPAVAGGALFEDTAVENIDIRQVRDENGQIRLMYAFINRSTIVITTDIRTLLELANRIRVAQVQNSV